MNLKFIKTDKCPKCGCEVVVSECISHRGLEILTHTNGGQWESRTFLCGLQVDYVPNFNKETFVGLCCNDEEYIALLKKREEDKKKVLQFLNDNEIDANLCSDVEDALRRY